MTSIVQVIIHAHCHLGTFSRHLYDSQTSQLSIFGSETQLFEHNLNTSTPFLNSHHGHFFLGLLNQAHVLINQRNFILHPCQLILTKEEPSIHVLQPQLKENLIIKTSILSLQTHCDNVHYSLQGIGNHMLFMKSIYNNKHISL